MDAAASRIPWKVLGASVTGVSHQKTGTPCQDACHWDTLPDGTVLLAVADGAGSAACSEVGAELAVRRAVSGLQEGLRSGAPAEESLIRAVFAEVNGELHTEAGSRGLAVGDLACTLCVAVLKGGFCLQGAVGDSGAIVCTVEDTLLSLLPPQKGEYTNETHFLTGRNWSEHLQVSLFTEELKGIMLGTDGLMDFVIRGNEPIERLATPLFRFIQQMGDAEESAMVLKEFLGSKNITSRIFDDVTLLMCWRRED